MGNYHWCPSFLTMIKKISSKLLLMVELLVGVLKNLGPFLGAMLQISLSRGVKIKISSELIISYYINGHSHK